MNTHVHEQRRIRELSEAGCTIALSVVLGNLRLLELPNGGSIAFGAIPLLAFALIYGWRTALPVCSIAGLLHALLGGTIVHPAQFVLDYGVGYAALALAGIVRNPSKGIAVCGIGLAFAIRYCAFVISGIIFFAQYVEAGGSAVTFSVLYNASFTIPEVVLAAVVLPRAVSAYRRSSVEAVGGGTVLTSPAVSAVQNIRKPLQIRVPAAASFNAIQLRPSATVATNSPVQTNVTVSPFSLRRPSALREWRDTNSTS